MKAPENLESLSKDELIGLVKQLFATVTALEEQVADLKRQLGQNSGNSSQPPSRDRYPRKLKKLGGKKGPPPGHDGVTRFGFGEPDHLKDLHPHRCGCGQSLEPLSTTLKDTWQVAELVQPVEITAYRRFRALCPACGEMNVAPWPEQVIPGQSIGPKLSAWLVYLHTVHNQSFAKLEQLCEDLLGLPMSQGTLQTLFFRASEALQPSIAQLQQAVQTAQALHCDETSWRTRGIGKYLWCAVTERFSYFWIHTNRSRKALHTGIGEMFAGACHSDFLGVYSCYPGQGCWAHLLRDVEACCQSPKAAEREFGLQLALWMGDLWALWREQASERLSRGDYLTQAAQARDDLIAWLARQQSLPKYAARLQKRILSQPERVFYFVTHPETPPDNNAAERALRGLVMNRKTTGGTRTEAGEVLKTTLFSIVQTCQKQGVRAIEYIQKALIATAHPTSPYPQLFMHAE